MNKNPCSNHEIHILFEHDFLTLQKPKMSPNCLHDVTRESVVALTDHFADDFVCVYDVVAT